LLLSLNHLQGEKTMKLKHPLARLFAPISMIVAIAATSVAVALADQDGDQNATTTAKTSPDMLETVAAVQTVPDRS